MQMITIELTPLHEAQKLIIRQSSRFNVASCGRRFGKTTLGTDRLAADINYPVAWGSPSYKSLIEIWREAVDIFSPIIRRKNIQERRLELITGGVFEFWSLDNADAIRGRKYKRWILDEWSIVPNAMDVWQMVIRPTLADMIGDAWIFGTPKGHNAFWQMYQWGQDPHNKEWASWQMPTSSNPFIPASEIEDMRRSMPERVFSQEILAEFIDDAGGVFRRVSDAATAVEQKAPVDGHRYIFGVDWGKHNDFTVISVIDTTLRALVYIDRFNQIDYTVQVGRLKALAGTFKPDAIVAEVNSMGDPLVEMLQRDGLPVMPFQTTNATKTAVIDSLALSFEKGSISIIPDPVVMSELQAYEMQRLPSGMFRYSAPDGMHDDTVMSLALGWSAVHEGDMFLFEV